jgi:hypothetical protein
MGMGGSQPTPQAAAPTPVPQQDDPKSLQSEQTAAAAAARRQGTTAHLLSGPGGVLADPDTTKAKLTAVAGPSLGGNSSSLLG